MKIQFETRAVVTGVVAVMSVIAILALAQTPTPTACPVEKLQFHLVMKCVQTAEFPNLVKAIKALPKTNWNIQIDDNAPEGCLAVPALDPALEPMCVRGGKPNSNVTQRLSFAKKGDLDTFIQNAGL